MYQYKENFTLPQYEAVRDIARGISSSGSVIVNQIAKDLNEKTKDMIGSFVYHHALNLFKLMTGIVLISSLLLVFTVYSIQKT